MKVKFTFEIGIVHKNSMALMGHHSIISTFGLQEIINEPTHIIGDSSSCIDLIFTSQPIRGALFITSKLPSLDNLC